MPNQDYGASHMFSHLILMAATVCDTYFPLHLFLMENEGSERSSKTTKVTRPVTGRVGTQGQVFPSHSRAHELLQPRNPSLRKSRRHPLPPLQMCKSFPPHHHGESRQVHGEGRRILSPPDCPPKPKTTLQVREASFIRKLLPPNEHAEYALALLEARGEHSPHLAPTKQCHTTLRARPRGPLSRATSQSKGAAARAACHVGPGSGLRDWGEGN